MAATSKTEARISRLTPLKRAVKANSSLFIRSARTASLEMLKVTAPSDAKSAYIGMPPPGRGLTRTASNGVSPLSAHHS